MLSIRIDLFLVLIAKCVESNPGPATKCRTGMQGNQGSEPTKPPETSPVMKPLQNNHESRAATRVRRSEVIHGLAMGYLHNTVMLHLMTLRQL